jgi:hypothetical protein
VAAVAVIGLFTLSTPAGANEQRADGVRNGNAQVGQWEFSDRRRRYRRYYYARRYWAPRAYYAAPYYAPAPYYAYAPYRRPFGYPFGFPGFGMGFGWGW